jgi:hypothetical protein
MLLKQLVTRIFASAKSSEGKPLEGLLGQTYERFACPHKNWSILARGRNGLDGVQRRDTRFHFARSPQSMWLQRAARLSGGSAASTPNRASGATGFRA